MFAIQTIGRASTSQRVESFRLEYSQDCATFNRLMDANGNNHVRHIFLITHFQITKVQLEKKPMITGI